MRLAVMQPYFFPYLGYFSLIAATDRFVVFDPVQFIRRGWINRNQILKPDYRTSQYVTVPIAKQSRETTIRDTEIAANSDWETRIVAQLQHYKKRAPYFADVMKLLRRCFDLKTNSIVELNLHCLQIICESLEIDLDVVRFETIERDVEPAGRAGEWAVNVSRVMNAKSYLNPIGGREIFDTQDFSKHGIELAFIQNQLTSYCQNNSQFIPGLSILDVMLFNSHAETRRLVDDFVILESVSESTSADTN